MTDGDTMARTIWILLVLMMVVSGLLARRIPLARLVTWSLLWVGLFLGIYLLFTMVGPQFTAWEQSRRGGRIEGPVGGNEASARHIVSIPMSEDGHFWVDAVIKGREVRFLVDSGASITALSQATADDLGLAADPMAMPIVMDTANGEVTAARATIPDVRIGDIRAQDLPVAVSASFGPLNVLGMNFLNKLRSWRVENGRMVLEAG